MRELLAVLLHLLFPTPCQICQAPLDARRRHLLCGRCWDKIRPPKDPLCPRCGLPLPSPHALTFSPDHLCGTCREQKAYFSFARAAGLYEEEGVLRKAILLFKYGKKAALGHHLGRLMAEASYGRVEVTSYDCLVPVPLSPEREKERGFNQSLILAEALGGRFGVPVERKALVRVRPTGPQEGSRKAREENVRGAFAVIRPEQVAGKRILLIDDVYTTGATVNECAKVLMKAGAQKVAVYTLARVE